VVNHQTSSEHYQQGPESRRGGPREVRLPRFRRASKQRLEMGAPRGQGRSKGSQKGKGKGKGKGKTVAPAAAAPEIRYERAELLLIRSLLIEDSKAKSSDFKSETPVWRCTEKLSAEPQSSRHFGERTPERKIQLSLKEEISPGSTVATALSTTPTRQTISLLQSLVDDLPPTTNREQFKFNAEVQDFVPGSQAVWNPDASPFKPQSLVPEPPALAPPQTSFLHQLLLEAGLEEDITIAETVPSMLDMWNEATRKKMQHDNRLNPQAAEFKPLTLGEPARHDVDISESTSATWSDPEEGHSGRAVVPAWV